MNAQHTPGPWEVAGDDKNGQAVVRAEHIEVATCWHHCVGSIEQEMRANAQLIAAAPTLLKAARIAVTALAHITQSSPHDEAFYGPAYRALDEAIAKATWSAA